MGSSSRVRIAYAIITQLIVVHAIDTKYFKRFYFGNLSVDLTDQLGERFNYDYLPPRSTNTNEHHGHGKNPHHRVPYTDAQHRHDPVPDASASQQQQQKPEPQQFQGDQPSPNGTSAPPAVTSNQPYRHQDLKALSRNITSILNSFNVSYDKRVRPNYGGDAVEVGITMFVLSISDLSEVEMDFTLDFYFRQMWKDQRLTFEGPTGVKQLSVSSEFLKSMWVPDTFFVNEKTSYFHTATTNNEFLRISEKGDILRSMRLTVCASCPMDLRHFPMDSQLCNIEIESFGYTMSDIRYKWNAGAGSVGMANDVSLPQFKVFGYRQKTYEISLSTGNYSRLACEIQFVRSMGYYLIQIYIPSSLIVVISWVSFWLNRNAAPARVYLGITTVLTMTTLMSSTNKALPKISYVKSIDVYLGTCFVMVFAALLEYATVGYLAKRIQMRKNHFAALQKMALQLQTARDEHVQKTYAPTTPVQAVAAPPQPQAIHAPPPILPQIPTTNPNTPHHSNPHTPHTPRYERTYEGSSTLRKYNTNNAQFINQMGSNVSIPYAHPQSTQQQQQQRPTAYDPNTRTYYDPTSYDRSQQYYAAQQQQQQHQQQQHQHAQQQYYSSRDSWGGEVQGGSSSRHASVKRRNHDDHHAAYAHQQNIINPPVMYNNPNTHVVVGSVIGTTSIEQAPQSHQHHHHPVPVSQAPVVQQQQQAPPQPPVGDRIRQLIPINPNQICGITPSDIDKYSRVVFPVCFVCFNLLYWIIYLHISNVNPTPDLVIMNPEG